MKGIDISNYQNNVDFAQVKASGVEIVYIKATEGVTYTSPAFRQQYQSAINVGLKVGVYHYLRANDPISEAKHFLSVIDGLRFDCKYAIDVEEILGQSTSQISSNVRHFADYLISQNKEPCIYTGSFFYTHNLDSSVKNIFLWVANYSVHPDLPSVGWQYSSTGIVQGVSNGCDVNVFEDGILLGGSTTTAPVYTAVNLIATKLQPRSQLEKAKLFIGLKAKELQTDLIACEFNCGGYGADGSFGQGTLDSLIAFQTKYLGINFADGLAGNQTFTKLQEIIMEINKPKVVIDAQVLKLQQVINRLIKLGLVEDGITGTKTKEGTIKLQQILDVGADGIAGNNTWSAINSVLAKPYCDIKSQGNKPAIRIIQNIVGTSVDGIWGSGTNIKVATWQKNHGLEDDAKFGTLSWNKAIG